MKKITLSICSLLIASTFACSNQTDISKPIITNSPPIVLPPDTEKSDRKIQVALLLDTSNSMDGLINQAKSRLWNIINTLGTLKYEGKSPQIEIALYEYGNDDIEMADGYVRQVTSLTTDLDMISKHLFELTTNGGAEFCGEVIHQSSTSLKWSDDDKDMKLIYIAGNESFSQGEMDYAEACADAIGSDIYVNTIFCGNYDTGISLEWKSGAEKGKGKYFNIDSDKTIQYVKTPYDDKISTLNTQLNGTYYGYGGQGYARKEMQMDQDENAVMMNSAAKTERAVSKSSANYSNATWDVIDAFNSDSTKVMNLKDEQLPQELKGKSEKEKLEFIQNERDNRVKIQTEIGELAVKRQQYIDENQSEELNNDDFGKAVENSIIELGKLKNFVVDSK